MNCADFVYTSIYKGSLKAGAAERAALDAATTGLNEWKKNKFQKPAKLIETKIKAAAKRARKA